MDGSVEGQLIFVTHDRDRPDKEVVVNGSYDGSEFVKKVSEVGREERWQREVSPQRFEALPGKKPTREDVLANAVSTFVDTVRGSVFDESGFSEGRFFDGSKLWGESSYFIWIGEVDGLLEKYVSDEGSEGFEAKIEMEVEDTESEPGFQDEVEGEMVGGGFICPAVWIDEEPERSFEKKVWGSPFCENEIVYENSFLEGEFLVSRDGLLVFSDVDVGKERTIEMFNTFLGVGSLIGYPRWRSLQPREYIPVEIDGDEVNYSRGDTSISSGSTGVSRSYPDSYNRDRDSVQPKMIEYILNVAEIVFPIEYLRERIILHLQAHTHFIDDEYTSSFLLNLSVVEQHIDDVLDRNLRDDYDVNTYRREDIQGDSWSIDHVLELAEITGTIDEEIYSELNRHLEKRNKVVHEMEGVPVERAEDLDHLVSEILCREINKHLETVEVFPIDYRAHPMKPATRRKESQGNYNPVKWR